MKVWIEGEIVDGANARIPVTDHGLLYGDGVFEGIRLYSGRVFRLDAHLERLRHSARAIGLDLPGGVAKIREIVLATARAYGQPDATCVPLVTRGDARWACPTTFAEPAWCASPAKSACIPTPSCAAASTW
jgi:branched-chain amino acid aminotransferase